MKILLGTYTRNSSEGIYEITLNTETKTLDNLKLVAKVDNATYLDYDPSTSTVYSVYQKGDQAGIAQWKREDDGQLEKLKTLTRKEVPPCYIKFKDGLVYTTNYHQGKMTIYNEKDVEREVQYEDGAHAHFADFDPKTNLLYVTDLGNDTLYKYKGDKELDSVKLEEGSGPRHLSFHPRLDRIYALAEHKNTITVLDSDFNIYQIISTLKDEATQSDGGAIRISQDGNFLYASNRGEDTIAVFEIDKDGALKKIQSISTEGEHPRDFALSPDEKFLVVANRDTNNLSLYSKDKETGKLELLEKDVHAPEAVAVYFLNN